MNQLTHSHLAEFNTMTLPTRGDVIQVYGSFNKASDDGITLISYKISVQLIEIWKAHRLICDHPNRVKNSVYTLCSTWIRLQRNRHSTAKSSSTKLAEFTAKFDCVFDIAGRGIHSIKKKHHEFYLRCMAQHYTGCVTERIPPTPINQSFFEIQNVKLYRQNSTKERKLTLFLSNKRALRRMAKESTVKRSNASKIAVIVKLELKRRREERVAKLCNRNRKRTMVVTTQQQEVSEQANLRRVSKSSITFAAKILKKKVDCLRQIRTEAMKKVVEKATSSAQLQTEKARDTN